MSDIKIEQSPGDQNKYQLFTLENGIQVLLIQDNNAKTIGVVDQDLAMAYCSLVVNAGSFNNPSNRHGLAHFLEHMVFMGSEKYPDPSSYPEHIGTYGGFSNAYTQFECTTYTFNVTYGGLEKTLDYLASAVDKPAFDKSVVDREITAIENEFQMMVSDDSTRMVQIAQENTSDKNHLFNTFAWGNAKSLKYEGNDLVDEVREFFKQNYSTDRMALVIQVKTIDDCVQLRGWVEQTFGQI